jgi:hypothetical protein
MLLKIFTDVHLFIIYVATLFNARTMEYYKVDSYRCGGGGGDDNT